MDKKVSIIIPVSNGEKTIANAITSCIDQTYLNIEILVIVNGSTDNTKSIVKGFCKEDTRVSILNCPVGGRSIARNIGLKAATGEYIQFLDADDTLQPKKVSVSVELLEKKNEYFAYATGIKYYDQMTESEVTNIASKSSLAKLVYENIFPINSLLFRNNDLTLFKDDLDYNEDWLFWVENTIDKKVYFNMDFLGGIVNITGSNTMKQYSTMLLYFVYVRGVIKNNYEKGFSLKSLIKDSRLIKEYIVICESTDEKINKYIYRSFRYTYQLNKLLFSVPIIKEVLKEKISKKINDVYNH